MLQNKCTYQAVERYNAGVVFITSAALCHISLSKTPH